MSRYRPPAGDVERRGPGRPRKRTREYLLALLNVHREVEAWFVAEHGRPPRSDRQMYTAYFAARFTAAGERASRASSAEFQGALKTLRNELAEARRLSTSPENAVILGTR